MSPFGNIQIPCWQVGGMADVVTALSRAVQDEGHRVEVIVPKYDIINYAEVGFFKRNGVRGFGSMPK